MRGPLAVIAALAATIAVAFVVTGALGSDDEPSCESAEPLSIDALARSLEPRYSSGTLSRAELEKAFAGLAAELPEGVEYEGRIISRSRQPVAYVLVMNSSREELAADDVYSGFASSEGGTTSEIPFAGQTGRLREVPGGVTSILAAGGCAAVTVGAVTERPVRDISRRLRLP